MATDRDAPPSPLQALILWALVVRGGTAKQMELKPELKKPDRDALVHAGLLREVQGKRPIEVELTDGGWAWVKADTPLPLLERPPAGTVVLAGLIGRLVAYMNAKNVALADIIRPPREVVPPPQPDPDVAGRIRAAYLAESGGAVNRRVRLAALRARLADVPRADLDAALLALAQGGSASLYPMDDPVGIEAADREAAIQIGVNMRHLLWLHR